MSSCEGGKAKQPAEYGTAWGREGWRWIWEKERAEKVWKQSRGMWERGVRVWSVWCGRTGARDKEGNEEEKAEVTRGVRGISEVCGLGSEGRVVVVDLGGGK